MFHLVDPLQHQDVFSKDLLGKFSVKMYLNVVSTKLTDKGGMHLNFWISLEALPLFGGQEKIIPSSIHSTQLGNMLWINHFVRNAYLKNISKLTAAPQEVVDIPDLKGFFSEIGNWCWGATKQPRPLNTTQSEDVALFFPHIVLSTTPTHRYAVLSPVLLGSRDQYGSPLNLTIDIYDPMEK